MIGLLTSLGVSEFAILLVTLLYIVQKRCLSLRIGSAKAIGTLEHQMFQIVGQTCGLCGIILRTRTHGDIGLNARLLVIHTEIDLQPILQRIDTRLHGVVLHLLVLVLRTANC